MSHRLFLFQVAPKDVQNGNAAKINNISGSGCEEDDGVIVEEEIEFNDFLQKHVGDNGRHQWVVLIAVCIADMVDCMLILAPIFVAAIPEHTCNVATYCSAFNCTDDESTNIFIPKEERHGKMEPVQCYFYNVTDIQIRNQTQDECSHLHFTNNLVVECDKWTYDSTFYTSTIVTEVNYIIL